MQRVEPSKVQPFPEPAAEAQPRFSPPPRAPQTAAEPAPAPAPHEAETPPRRPAASSGDRIHAVSLAFALIWVGGVCAYLVGLFGLDGIAALSGAWLGLIVAVLIVPVILCGLIAMLAREADALRRHSTSLAAVASHLIEPEEQASRNMARLGRAIRRELDQFNTAVEAATSRMVSLQSATSERLALIERTANAAQDRVDRATAKLGTEREKLAQFTQALDSVVLAASETLTSRLQDARAAARAASESLHAEHGAINGLITTLQAASTTVSAKALETGKEIERQAQRLDAASEAAAARSEQVVVRHERQRAVLAETIDRLKQENDHMTRALEYQREGMGKMLVLLSEETKKIGVFTVEGARRLDEAAALMAQRIVETTQLFSREAEKLRTSSELTSSGLEQAMQTIRAAGDNSFDAAGRLGSVLIGLRDTATSASQQIEGTFGRLSKILQELPGQSTDQANSLRQMIEMQAQAVHELSDRVGAAYDRVQAIDLARQQALPGPQASMAPQLAAPQAGGNGNRHGGMPQAAPLIQLDEPLRPGGRMQRHRDEPQTRPAPPQSAAAYPLQDGNRGQGNRGQAGPGPMNASLDRNPADRPLADRQGTPGDGAEQKSWFNLARRLVRPLAEGQDVPQDDRNNWDMKSLLAAAETRDGERGPAPRGTEEARVNGGARPPGGTAREASQIAQPVSARHIIETLQAMAIDLSRFLEDDPPLDLLRRYRAGERNVFARRLAGLLGPQQARLVAAKYREDREFRDTVDRYILQFETLLEQTARSERESGLVETYLTSQTGKVYMALASAIGRLS